MKLYQVYLIVGVLICLWFTVAAANKWRAPDLGIANSSGSSGRGYGGAWGGGK